MPDYPFDLTGRTAIVTGGGTGIGAASARVLALHGADVVIASRKIDVLEAAATSLAAASGRRILPVRCDVREEDDVRALVQQTVDTFGRLDILVNNAGGSYLFPLRKMPPNRWDNAVSLNLRAPYLAMYHAADHLIRSPHASVINISSVAGIEGVKGGAAYGAAKAGLQQLSRIAAAEWGPHGIRCNAIAVGEVASEGALRAWERFGESAESAGKRAALRRVGQPDDIAWCVFYLASDMSTWVTGQVIGVDGGPRMRGLEEPDD